MAHIDRSRGSLQKVQDPVCRVGGRTLHVVVDAVGRHLRVGGVAGHKVTQDLALDNLTGTSGTDYGLPLVGCCLFL